MATQEGGFGGSAYATNAAEVRGGGAAGLAAGQRVAEGWPHCAVLRCLGMLQALHAPLITLPSAVGATFRSGMP